VHENICGTDSFFWGGAGLANQRTISTCSCEEVERPCQQRQSLLFLSKWQHSSDRWCRSLYQAVEYGNLEESVHLQGTTASSCMQRLRSKIETEQNLTKTFLFLVFSGTRQLCHRGSLRCPGCQNPHSRRRPNGYLPPTHLSRARNSASHSTYDETLNECYLSFAPPVAQNLLPFM
jgi:hypothetical protein